MRRVLLALLACACAKTAPVKEPAQKPPPVRAAPPPAPALPAGFVVKGEQERKEPFLGPEETWRFLLARLTTLRADARAAEQDLLVTFEADAVHVTDRAGARRSWLLPDGLRLDGVPIHVRLGGDLTTSAYGPDGAQIPAAEEITVVRARIGGREVFRLIIKGGEGFRSISNTG